MFLIRWFVIVAVVAVVVGCQSGLAPTVKAPSAATCTQDVIVAWDAVCGTYSFLPCPDNAGEPNCTETMLSMYYGAYFAVDCKQMMEAIRIELLSSDAADPSIDDSLNAVLTDAAWLE
jgi:hypothetical protein